MGSAVLIANRGEIAVRVARAAAAAGLRSVAVYAEDDAASPHVRLADEAHPLPGSGPAAYLDATALLAVAQAANCAYVHPGYGFLSEDADFARSCAEAGTVFIGPSPDVLGLFGDKARARDLARSLDVPVLPGTSGPTTLDEARAFLTDGPGAGGPVMVKALGGGGGRGMRIVRDATELAEAWKRCRSEAEQGFGRGDLYVERLLTGARHIEVQVIGDTTGAVTHVWERDCSAQRRHQKLIEIAPAPALPASIRDQLLQCATRMAREVGYAGVGTFEFLVRDDEFHFMEANPRLQVEHTVTEEVTGIDLVDAQLRLAAGATLADLGLADGPPPPRGFAVQARVNAEVTTRDGRVRGSAGTLTRFEVPTGPGVRVDTGACGGLTVGARYDPLLAKVITRVPAPDFTAACERTRQALAEFTVEGVRTGIPLLRAVLAHPEFAAGSTHTSWVTDHLPDLITAADTPPASEGDKEGAVTAPMAGTVVTLDAAPGDTVRAGQQLLVLEAMKMEHVLTAPTAGTVRTVRVAVGDTASEGQPLLILEPSAFGTADETTTTKADPDAIRADLAEALARHAVGLDAQRPEAVAKRHALGRRTARENIADLCDKGSFTEFGALALAAQRRRRSLDDLIASTPADGMVTGTGTVDGAPCVAMSYDYTVLAGTQGHNNHRKTDRLLSVAEQRRLPVVLFAEGGGGRPGDTDTASIAGLDIMTFHQMGKLSGLVPLIGIASGRCFAGNAALLGCCDVVIATPEASIGMGGPAMIEGGGLGSYAPEEVGPLSVQVPNGVVDIPVADEAEAVRTAKRYLSYFRAPTDDWQAPDPRLLRHTIPENRRRAYPVRQVIDALADTDSVLELRPGFGTGMVTALVRVAGRPLGLVANNPQHLGGAIDRDAADKAARFLQLCDAFGLPVLALCDTPGFMVGPDAERDATVRHFARLFVTGANLRVPVVSLILRKAYGLGAMAMMGGSTRAPLATAAWPTGELGGMGLEGAVRLGYRKELEAIPDPADRQRAFESRVAELYDHGKAVNAAAALELDAVIDPATSRDWITSALAGYRAEDLPERGRGFVDTW
ncbi:carboxyl transferase domain-containing protein [Streptomyces sp. NPDC042319]|uniref:carboxyl transferase domain-containing protein n=1 Tax=Streptomyces sp. NPDC042319 TaxID=3154332 RepID=UPI0033D527A3